MDLKLAWLGSLLAVQPRIRLTRSFDERTHSYLGFVLRVRGTLEGVDGEFGLALGKAAQAKHGFRVGDEVQGAGVRVADPRLETADLYKASGVRLLYRGPESVASPPPFLGPPPTLEVYRARGPRRLAAQTFTKRCATCFWACEMAVEMIIDQWDPSKKRYRRETWCYGPKSCRFYSAGPTRKVPGRHGMSWEEEDWVDAEATAHRGLDE